MINKLWALCILALPLLSNTIIKQNIFEKDDSVDIMLTFDAPFEGKITKKKDEKNTILILEDVSIGAKITKDINSSIVQTLQLIPTEKQLFIQLSGKDDFTLDASKTIDLYGLRLRIKTTQNLANEKLQNLSMQEEIKTIQTKKEDNIASAYLKMILVLVALMGFLYLLKKWMENRGENIQGSWLFEKTNSKKKKSVKIIEQHPIDIKNKVARIAYGEKEYLVLLGNSNLLLDTFERTKNEESFDNVLTQNKEALEEFITQKSSHLNRYKEKASNP